MLPFKYWLTNKNLKQGHGLVAPCARRFGEYHHRCGKPRDLSDGPYHRFGEKAGLLALTANNNFQVILRRSGAELIPDAPDGYSGEGIGSTSGRDILMINPHSDRCLGQSWILLCNYIVPAAYLSRHSNGTARTASGAPCLPSCYHVCYATLDPHVFTRT